MFEYEVREMVDYMVNYYGDDFISLLEGGAGVQYKDALTYYPNDKYDVYAGCSRIGIVDYDHDLVYKMNYVKFNYCEKEYRNYIAAQDAHLEGFFIPTYKVYVNEFDTYIYVQPRVDFDEDVNMEYVSSDIDEESDWGVDECDLVMNCLPSELIDFLNENDINDVHVGNIVIEDDSIRIFDYAGYGLEDIYGERGELM